VSRSAHQDKPERTLLGWCMLENAGDPAHKLCPRVVEFSVGKVKSHTCECECHKKEQ
jgi:hypothetical protein